MMRILFFCSFTLACLASDSTQSIRGVVVDPSGRPVEGARVLCNSHKVFTNIDGRFELSNTASCDATIEKAGFELATPKLSGDMETRVILSVQGPTDSVIV